MTLDLSDEELVALFQDEPFDFHPGEGYQYNNSGFYLLGIIIEKASGETYREYLDAHLFEPLDLTGSSYCDERPIIPGRAEGYERVGEELVNDAYLEGEATFLELIDSQQQLLAANVAARQALYQFLSDLLTLEQSMAYYPFFEEDADARVRELEAKLEGR